MFLLCTLYVYIFRFEKQFMHPPPSHGFINENNPSIELIKTNHYLHSTGVKNSTPQKSRELFTNIPTRYKSKTKNTKNNNNVNKGVAAKSNVNLNIGNEEHMNLLTDTLGR